MSLLPQQSTRAFCISLLAVLLLLGCSNGGNAEQTEQVNEMATRAFTNGAIYTVNPKQPWAQAVAIRGNEIIYVGDDDKLMDYIDTNTQVTNLKGKMMIPGFHDVHIHPIESASENTLFTLNSEQTDIERFADIIADAAEQNPNARWLIGYGHSIFSLLESERLPIDILDEVVPHRPVIIMEQTSHSMWVNSKALELAGFDETSPDPTGGVLMREPQSNRLSGVLIDNAGNIAMDIALQPTAQSLENDYLGLVEYTLPELAKLGITSIADARSFWQRDDHKTWLKVAENDEMTVRANIGLWAYPEMNDSQQIKELKELYSYDRESFLKFNQIKVYSDGILINGTAAMHEPYDVDLIGLTGNRGLNYFSQERLQSYIEQLTPIGFDFHIHAIGDRGIHQALNAIEAAAQPKGRHRLTHVEIVDTADLPRFLQLNVTADAQVAGAFTNPEHWQENDALIGPKRADNPVPVRALSDAGARVTLSSDWNVSSLNPFIGLQNAVTRAPQALSLAEAIKAYTLNSAYVLRQEDKVGSIEVGKLADLVVLDRHLFNIPADTINQTKIIETLLDGETIFKR